MGVLNQLVEVLGKLGFNTTRLKWKLFQLEKRFQQKSFGIHLPASLQWLAYPHKRCRHCNGIVAREERTCPHCGKRAPSLIGYKITRLLGVALPQGTPVMLGAFMVVIILNFMVMIAMQGMSALVAPQHSAMFGAWTVSLRDEWWRYLSFGLAHGGIIHIAFNMFALTQVGPVVEDRIGPWRMLVLITVTQIASALASYLYYYSFLHNPFAGTVGASGWLFGLIGFGISYFDKQVGVVREYREQLIKWAMYSLVFGFVMGANNAAHVGGGVAGYLMGLIPEARRQSAPHVKAVWNVAAAVCAILWIATLAYLSHAIVTGWQAARHAELNPPEPVEAPEDRPDEMKDQRPNRRFRLNLNGE